MHRPLTAAGTPADPSLPVKATAGTLPQMMLGDNRGEGSDRPNLAREA